MVEEMSDVALSSAEDCAAGASVPVTVVGWYDGTVVSGDDSSAELAGATGSTG